MRGDLVRLTADPVAAWLQLRAISGLHVLGSDTIDREAAQLCGAVDDWKLAIRFDEISGPRPCSLLRNWSSAQRNAHVWFRTSSMQSQASERLCDPGSTSVHFVDLCTIEVGRRVCGCAGFSAARLLEHEHGVVAEMATDMLVLFMFGIGTTAEHLRRLGDALAAVAAHLVGGQLMPRTVSSHVLTGTAREDPSEPLAVTGLAMMTPKLDRCVRVEQASGLMLQ